MPDEGDEVLAEPHQPGHSVIGINWQITTSLMFMVFMSSLGLISWALTSANHAADALAQLSDLRVDTARQIEQLRAAAVLAAGQSIHLDNVEKWISQADASREQQDKRLAALEQQAALLNAQLGSITAASSVHLGPRR